VKLQRFFRGNLILKITSLNAVVITIRLIVSVFIQRLLAVNLGEAGIANIGQVRNLIGMVTSTSTFGTFSGIVKYVAQYRQNLNELAKLFSTTLVFLLIGSALTAMVLFFGAETFSIYFFGTNSYGFVLQLLAVLVPFVALNRVISAVVNGLSEYKKYAKIELISYLLATVAIIIGLYTVNLEGVLIAIIVAPVIQLGVVLAIFGPRLSDYVQFNSLTWSLFYKNKLLAFTLMSFVSTFMLNYIELDIRTLITAELNINEAGYWTALNFISKNYMVFASGLFTLYVIPRFANIYEKETFKNEVLNIYKTILPIFGLGMLLVYLLRNFIIEIIYPDFTGMEPLFKWQLLGDFIRLCSLVLAHQFLAKRMVKSFIITEIISLLLFFTMSKIFVQYYGTEGIVIAHFIRYVIYLIIVIIVIRKYFDKQGKEV
jgi:PST family polysaccharide transporter